MRAAVLASAALVVIATSASAATRAQPVLGHPWGINPQQGYGRAKPKIVSNGGDATGVVRAIKWTAWGRGKAVGTGTSTYVWPGTNVATNKPVRGARIVAFKLGTCAGRRAYMAVEWYFPKYGETFNPKRYINACTGIYVGYRSKITRCPNVSLHGHTAKNVGAIGMTCSHAKSLIKQAPVARYLRHGGRYVQSGFRCGTQGVKTPPASFDCRSGRSEFSFSVAR